MADSMKRGSRNKNTRPKKKSEILESDVKEVFLTATEQGDTEKVRKLLEDHGIQPDLTTTRQGLGRSVLSVAATYGQAAVVAELLKGGANPMLKSASQRVPLHDACIGGHVECVQLLAEVMSDVNVIDSSGQTAAHLAAFNGETKVLKVLLDKGANMTAEDQKGRQPAHLAATRNHVAVLRLLFESGVDLGCQCKTGRTPLHYAAQYGGYESLVFLVEKDCDTMITDVSTYLPAHLAARYDKLDCLKFLIKHGTSLDACQSEGRACSHIAAFHGGVNALHWLLEAGTDVNLTDRFGNTPAHYAAEGGKADCLNCCLQHDADLMVSNIKGDKPLDTAKKHGHFLLMERALKNEITCPWCFKKFEQEEYDQAHAPAPVERSIMASSVTAYTSPLPVFRPSSTQHQRNLLKVDQKKKASVKKLPAHDLTTKYFGEHLDPNGVFRFKAT